jgi:hypothetical protein
MCGGGSACESVAVGVKTCPEVCLGPPRPAPGQGLGYYNPGEFELRVRGPPVA